MSLAGRLVASIIIARSLGTEGTGRIAYFIWITETANVLTNFGLRHSLTRFLAELGGQQSDEKTRDLAAWIYRRYLLLSLVGVCAIGIVASALVSSDDSTTIWMLLALLFLARGLQLVYRAYLTGIQRFDILARINVFAGVSLVSGMGLGVYFFGLPGALGGYIVGSLLPALCSLSILRGSRTASLPDAQLRRRIWTYAIHTWLAGIVTALTFSRAEIFFVELYWNDHEVAMFSIGLVLSGMVTQTAMMFSGAFLPHFAELSGKRDMERIADTYESGTRLLLLVFMPVAFGGAAIVPVLLPFLYGAKFAPAVPNAMVLMVLCALNFATVGSALIYGLGHSKFVVLLGLLTSTVFIVGCVLLIPISGAWGAVWVRAVVQTVSVGIGIWFLAHHRLAWFPFRFASGIFSASLACTFIAWIPLHAVNSVWAIPFAVVAGAVTYFCVIRWFDLLDLRDIQILARVARRVPNPLGSCLRPAVAFMHRGSIRL